MARPHKIYKKVIPSGTRFGRWTVIEEDTKRGNSGQSYYICRCDCGVERSVRGTGLRDGSSLSCGCLNRDIVSKDDRLVDHVLYKTWGGMKQRCYNPNNLMFKNYGGRGIVVCDEWRYDYIAFEKWSMENGYKAGLTIDRIDNDGNYCPENCRWVTHTVQARNKRKSIFVTINGVTKCLFDWADEYGIQHVTMTHRWRRGWRGAKLISPPDYRMRNSLAKCEMLERYIVDVPPRKGVRLDDG